MCDSALVVHHELWQHVHNTLDQDCVGTAFRFWLLWAGKDLLNACNIIDDYDRQHGR